MRARKSNLRSLFCLVFAIFALSTDERSDRCVLLPLASALSSSLKLNANGQPRLCSLVEGSLNGLTRLCFGKATHKEIRIDALSNRKVLQGKIESLQVSIRQSQSSLLALNSFNLQGKHLNFGYLPLAVFAGIPALFWFVSVRSLLYILLLSFLWRHQREYFFSPERIKAIEDGFQHQKQKLSKLLTNGPLSCRLQYTISMTNESLKNSTWVQLLARSLLQSFMANSALPLAAAVSDVTNNNLRLLEESSTSTTGSKSEPNLKNANINDGNNPILALWKEQEQQQEQTQQLSSSSMMMTPASSSFPMTELFAATSFELRESSPIIFAKDGHVWLPCVANLPDDSASKLEFTLRTKPKVFTSDNNFGFQGGGGDGLEFTAAECSVNVDAVVNANTNTPEWAKQFLPSVVWLPIGTAGMVLPVIGGSSSSNKGKIHQLKRITVREGSCQLRGQVDLFPNNNTSKQQTQGFGKTLGNMLRSFNTKRNDNDRPKLPGGK